MASTRRNNHIPIRSGGFGLVDRIAESFGLQYPRTAKNAAERVFRFVAHVLVNPAVCGRPHVLPALGLRPNGRILYGKSVEQGVSVNPTESLDDMQVARGTGRRRAVIEVGRVDHEGIGFPAPHGIP